MTINKLTDTQKAFFSDKIHACPLRKDSTSFQLVDETGDGKPYAGLKFEAVDYEDIIYNGTLDATGSGKVESHYCGPLILKLNQRYQGSEKPYERMMNRPFYPLPITELQVRAESTRLVNKNGQRTKENPAQQNADSGAFYQVEVRDLVEHIAHLPEVVTKNSPAKIHVFKLFRKETLKKNARPYAKQLGYSPTEADIVGIPLLANKHHVLEVRPLRALRPMISTDNTFCVLNLYQLALFSTLSYMQFEQSPNKTPINVQNVTYPVQPSSGNWFGNSLPKFDELWKVDSSQNNAYYPLYEDVPYSKRFEIIPFDPILYPLQNNPELGDDQEHPEKIHFLDDRNKKISTDTQAYITHSDKIILIAVRGTNELWADAARDADAEQVPFTEGVGMVHNGFYEAAIAVHSFVIKYLTRFYSGQKLVITGHSLGGAITLLLSEMLRRRDGYNYDILLYTYGSPRAGNTEFVEAAKELTHHRMVNNNDPVPSVPATWMDTSRPSSLIGSAIFSVFSAPIGVTLFTAGLVNLSGDPYQHHGTLHYFMPVNFGGNVKSSILWSPSCSTLNDQGCTKALRKKNGLPSRDTFLRQILNATDHKMVASYIPRTWATLRRWQESMEKQRNLITDDEYGIVDEALLSLKKQLRDMTTSAAHSFPFGESHEDTMQRHRMSTEIDSIQMSRDRLSTLIFKVINANDVYGEYGGLTAIIDEALARWKEHPENAELNQLAMIPTYSINDDYEIAALVDNKLGSPSTLDIDSIM